MAEYTKTLSGGSASSQYRIRMVVTESNVNINNNTSVVNVTAYLDKLSGSGYYSSDGKPWNIKIDGSTVASGNKTYDFRKYTTLTLGSGSKTITHNSDGSKSVAVSAYFSSSPYLGSATVSATFKLTTIARASSISSITGGTELNQQVTVNISRKSTSFTHKVEYSYAGSSYNTVSTNAPNSYSFTPPISLASYVPNSTSGTLTVRVTTYNGSTQIGSSVTATKTLNVPASVVPTMSTPSVTRIDNGVPSDWGVYVQSFSKATVSMTGVAGAYGSTIRSYSITGGGLNTNTSSATTGVLNTSGTITFTCTVIDSRGRSVSKSASINVVAYSPPSLSLVAERSDPSGTPNASAGTCAKVTATFSFASVSGKNSITSKSCSCNGQTNTSFASGTPFVLNANLSIGASYTVTATITDALGRSIGPITVSISSAKRIMNIKANKNGMGIGKFAEEDNVLDIAWDVKARRGLTIMGDPVPVIATPPNLPSGVTWYTAWVNVYDHESKSNDKYWILISSDGYLFYGRQLNGATSVTWQRLIKNGDSPTFSTVYASNGSIQTSDRRLKHDIKAIDDRYIKLFKSLKPITYIMNDGERVHVGFISQDVEEAMNEVGLTDLEFAGFCKDVKQEEVYFKRKIKTIDENGEEIEQEIEDKEWRDVLDDDGNRDYIYSLRYEEFIALNTRMIQDLMAKVEDQQKIIDEQNKRLETLEAEILAIKDLLMPG